MEKFGIVLTRVDADLTGFRGHIGKMELPGVKFQFSTAHFWCILMEDEDAA